MRLGYSFWGFLGDYKIENGKEVSTPDGNATYGWSIIHEAQKRGWTVFQMQRDRDTPGFNMYGRDNFASFSSKKRLKAWWDAQPTFGESLPDLDVLLVEWRFPIPGRNFGISPLDPSWQPDLARQNEILTHYKNKGTKIILWDLDHKLTQSDEFAWSPDAIFETSSKPRELAIQRTRVEPPFVIDDLLQIKTKPSDPKRKLAYIGSRYERDDVIEEYMKPVSEHFPGGVEFWGNWTREDNFAQVKAMWPQVSYNRRITPREFGEVYGTAVACPLLGKKSYFRTGFITPRVWEALLFGTIPIGLSEHWGISDYVLFAAHDGRDLIEVIDHLDSLSYEDRNKLRHENIQKIHFMDVRYFIDTVEAVANGNLPKVELVRAETHI